MEKENIWDYSVILYDAVEVRKKAENKYFKEWSYANSMNKDNEGEK